MTTEEYFAGKDLAPRPLHSVMDLSKLRATGFEPEDARVALERYVAGCGRQRRRVRPASAGRTSAR